MRKLAAIIFTDIVGYTALMGEDERKALALLQKNRDFLKSQIKQCKGRWLKEMGDGTLSSFASAVDAVNCALEIQHILKDDPDLTLRIGIHIGDVVFEGGDVFGDGVNVASRIEPLAEPGGICISGRVYDDIRNKPDIETVFLGDRTLKHVKRPIKVYAITGEGLPTPLTETLAAEPALSRRVGITRRQLGFLGGIIVGIAIVVLGYLFLAGQRLEADEPIPIAVVDFLNETDEPELDGLSGMLITSLEQSRRLAVLTRSRMFDILKQLGDGDVEHIDESLGKDIARHAQLDVLVIASIRKLGRMYIIDLKALAPDSDEYLFTAREEGVGQESILVMLDKLAEKTRTGLKEKLTEVRATSRMVAEVTTPDLEAYQHYFQGEEYINKLRFDDAQAEFRQAVALDSNFALAWYRLAYATSWSLDEEQLAREHIRKAFRRLDRIPAKERYLVRAEKAHIEEGIQAGLVVLREMEQVYSDDKEMIYNIGDWSWHMGDMETAVEYLEKVLAMDPTVQRALQHLTWTYQGLGLYEKMLDMAQRFVDAAGSGEAYGLLGQAYVLSGQFERGMEILREAQQLLPGSASVTGMIADLYVYQGQFEKALAELKPLLEETQPKKVRRAGYAALSGIYPYRGEYRKLLSARDAYTELCWQLSDTAEAVYSHFAKAAYLERGWRDVSAGWKEMEQAIPLLGRFSTGKNRIALAYAEVSRRNYQTADSLAKVLPLGYYLAVRSLIACQMDECSRAEALVDSVLQVAPGHQGILALYNLAECQFRAKQYEEAVESARLLQTIYDNSFGFRATFYPKSFYLLGKIYEAMGETNPALENYEVFLDMWKNADGDLPDLIDAKERYAKLKARASS
jgi:class 3 adenylate cyclase/tetratricopeptide (TPR) repeat protein